MLPQEHRLKSDKDIKALFAKGKGVFGSLVTIKYKKNTLGVSRFAIVAGLKVSKKAVERNRLKRQARAIIHEQLANIMPGIDIGILLKKEALTAPRDELKTQIIKGLKKATLL